MNSVQSIVDQLAVNAKYAKSVQEDLRAYVTDKSHSLANRWEVWSKWCDKKEESYVIHASDYPIVGAMVDNFWPCDYDKYAEYDWESFLDWVEDSEHEEEESFEIDGQPVTVRILKESLIQTNFGSFCMDW